MTDNSDFWQDLYRQSQQHTIAVGSLPVLRMNHDLQVDAQVNGADAPWLASPAEGVRRIALERDGGEITTRATSLVTYRAGSHFTAHTHPQGEEILVLSGIFSDESGHYAAGSYLRNPPGSTHAPFSEEGCLIFVKLQQFSLQDSAQLALGPPQASATLAKASLTRRVLFERPNERVELIHFRQATHLPTDLGPRGFEVLVLKGELTGPVASYPVGTWLRCAPSQSHAHRAHAGTEIYIKSGHLGGFS
jgi:anti-sigma factor ChrR (cupin superfamily)